MRLVLAGSGLAILLATAAVASAQQASGQGGQNATERDPNEVVCRRTQESGSLARRPRRCLTRAQWDRLAEQQRANSPGMTAMSGSQSGQ